MSYLTQSDIAVNYSMRQRVAQCAAGEANWIATAAQADQWTAENSREWAASPGWADAWEYALATHSNNPDAGYDPGSDEGVITDGMILSAIQPMVNPPDPIPLEEPVP